MNIYFEPNSFFINIERNHLYNEKIFETFGKLYTIAIFSLKIAIFCSEILYLLFQQVIIAAPATFVVYVL